MKKNLLIIAFLVLIITSSAQNKFYVMPEIGINSTITSDFTSNYQNVGISTNLKVGMNITNHLALETGFGWSKINDFYGERSYYLSDDNSYTSSRSLKISSDKFFSVPLYLKISHDIISDKLKVFTFFGPRYVFGKLNYGTCEPYTYVETRTNNPYYSNEATGNYQNCSVDGKSFQPQFLFDGGFGIEYSLNKKMSLIGQASYSLGSRPLNSNIHSIQSDNLKQDIQFENIRWKGDAVNMSLGLKIHF